MNYFENIKKIRIEHKKTQKETAIIINSSQSNYSKKEKGIIDFTAEEIILFCNEFKISADELLGIGEVSPKEEKQ